MTTTSSGSEIIERLKKAVFPSYALLAAVQLDLFTALKDGSKTAEEVAEDMGTDPDKLSALLYPLVLTGLLTVEDERFSNSPDAGQYLIRGEPGYLGDEYEASTDRWTALSKTAESIRTGKAQHKIDFPSMSQEKLESFYRAGYSQTQSAGRGLASRYDFSLHRSLIDVGGGTGGIAIALTEAYPLLRATVVDFPAVIPVTQKFIDESSVASRVKAMAGNIVDESITGSFDVAILRNFIPVLTKEQARSAIKNVWRILDPGGSIYITDLGTLDDDRLSPQEMVWQNLMFINSFDQGGGRTEQERREWLTEAGSQDIERTVQANGVSIMTARKQEQVPQHG